MAGVASLVRSYAPQLSAAQVKQILVDSADDLGDQGWDALFGAGRLNACRALQMTPMPPIRFELSDPPPETIAPNAHTVFTVSIADGTEQVVGDSVWLVYREVGSDGESSQRFVQQDDGSFSVEFPALACGKEIEYYLTATGDGGSVVVEPRGAPNARYTTTAVRYDLLFADDFESDLGWHASADGGEATTGKWVRDVPIGTFLGGQPVQPSYDRSPDAGTKCFVTGQHFGGSVGNNDVDGGPVRLVSPIVELPAADVEVSYAVWFYSSVGKVDELGVEMSRDGGSTWFEIEGIASTDGWETRTLRLGDYPKMQGDRLRMRFTTADLGHDSLTEAAIDDVSVRAILCDGVPGDVDGDGDIDLTDHRRLTQCLLGPATVTDPKTCGNLDFDGDSRVDLTDVAAFLARFGSPEG